MTDHARPPEGVETWTAYVCSNCGVEEVAHSIHGMGCASGLNHVFEATEAVKLSALLAEREARERAEKELRSTARDLLDAAVARGDFEADRDAAVARAEVAERQLAAVDEALPAWEAPPGQRYAVGRVQTILNLKARAARAEQAEAERDELRARVCALEEVLGPIVERAEGTDEDAWVKVARAALSPDPSGETDSDPLAADRQHDRDPGATGLRS